LAGIKPSFAQNRPNSRCPDLAVATIRAEVPLEKKSALNASGRIRSDGKSSPGTEKKEATRIFRESHDSKITMASKRLWAAGNKDLSGENRE
jgi:hypothetical protein